MPSLTSDIIGRVKRLPLRPSASSALMPLFEAVSNGLHAVQDRFKESTAKSGTIEIQAHRYTTGSLSGHISGFTIADNGIGLTRDNFDSFLMPDSQYKLTRGGKGVGRLGWLKVFQNIRVDSHYLDEEGTTHRRDFKFILAANEQILLNDESQPLPDKIGTRIYLSDFDGAYGPKCPSRWQTIAERLIGHFLPVFAAGSAPLMVYHDGDEYLDLRDYFKDQIVDQQEREVATILSEGETVTLTIRHLKAKKAIRAERTKWHWLFLTANERAVEEASLDDTLGLKALDGEFVYFGCASGDFLNENVNQERTGFTFDAEDNTIIRRTLARAAREFLIDHIRAALQEKMRIANVVISENPQFIYIQGELAEFVEHLPPNATSREEILIEMSRHRFRRQREFKGVEQEIQKSATYTTAIAEKVEDYKQFVQEEQKGALAEYVLKRKSVLDLLDKFVGFEDAERDRHHLEQAVHALICPMRTDSASLEISDHNLWIADDRLAFFSFFASDKQFRAYTTGDSTERPDIAFFYDTCLAWRESDNPNTVVLVEFKRPGREDYPADDNPLDQVLGYVEKFKTTSLKDSHGRVLGANLKNAAFHCYIVADLTDGLRRRLRGHGDPTPDGDGLFGYTSNPRIYFEVIPYAKLIRDAKARNAVFFQKLGLNDHGSVVTAGIPMPVAIVEAGANA
jgi:hypothetical protein